MMEWPEEANQQEIMDEKEKGNRDAGVRDGWTGSAERRGVTVQTGTVFAVSKRDRERKRKRERACVRATFFIVSRIEMCVSGVGNEPQKEGGK